MQTYCMRFLTDFTAPHPKGYFYTVWVQTRVTLYRYSGTETLCQILLAKLKINLPLLLHEPGELSQYWDQVTDWTMKVLFPVGVGIHLFANASGLALGPTQSSIEWLPGVYFRGVKRSERKADFSLPLCTEVKDAWSYTSMSMLLHSIVFTYSVFYLDYIMIMVIILFCDLRFSRQYQDYSFLGCDQTTRHHIPGEYPHAGHATSELWKTLAHNSQNFVW
jgi:hypothetical protein